MHPMNFGPAFDSERWVFGSATPEPYAEWFAIARQHEIERVVMLTDDDDVLAAHRDHFRDVMHAPIDDYHYADAALLADIARRLQDWRAAGHRAVVHCHGGSGRTGHVLASWLVCAFRDHPTTGEPLTAAEAIALVTNVPGVRRNPREASIRGGPPLEHLLDRVRDRFLLRR